MHQETKSTELDWLGHDTRILRHPQGPLKSRPRQVQDAVPITAGKQAIEASNDLGK